MEKDIIKKANEIVEKTEEEEKLVSEAIKIAKGMYDGYVEELKDLWEESESDLLCALVELKSVWEKLNSLGEIPDIFSEHNDFSTKLSKILKYSFKLLPDMQSANVKALEDIYEKGKEPYLYGRNDLKENKNR